MNCVIPAPSDVSQMLAMLYGDGLSVSKASAPDLAGSFAGVYINPEGETIAICLADKPGAAYMSAALSLVPPHQAETAASSGNLSEMMVGNLYEVMNILTRLVMDDESMHLKLDKVLPADEIDSLAALTESGSRCDFSVSVPKYGDGVLSFLIT